MKKKKKVKHRKVRKVRKAPKRRKPAKKKTLAIVPIAAPPVLAQKPANAIRKVKEAVEDLERVRRFISQCLNVDLQIAEKKAEAEGKQLDADVRKRLEVDWGTIPGIDKPFLLQPGAEKFMHWLQIRPVYHKNFIDLGEGHIEMAAFVKLFSRVSGEEVFEGPECSCSTMETNYRYVWAEMDKKPDEETMNRLKAIKMGKNQLVFEWRKGKKVGQRCAWFERVDNPNIHNERNKVRQMGQKRALVKAIRNMGAISQIFSADPSEWIIEQEDHDGTPETEMDYTEQGGEVLVNGKSRSGRREARQAEETSKLDDKAPHAHVPGSPQAKQAEDALRRSEEEDARLAAAKNVTPKPAPAEKPAAKPKPAKPNPLAGMKLVTGTLFRAIQSTAKTGAPVIDVQIGNTHYRCFHKNSLFKYLIQYGQMGGFNIQAYINDRGTIEGLKKIGPVMFEDDGKTEKVFTREPGQEG
jgi:hypothetical protein